MANSSDPQKNRDESSAAQGRHFATLGDAVESIRQALAWPPDASYEAMFADARKGLNEVIDRFSKCDRKRYEAEREVERLSRG